MQRAERRLQSRSSPTRTVNDRTRRRPRAAVARESAAARAGLACLLVTTPHKFRFIVLSHQFRFLGCRRARREDTKAHGWGLHVRVGFASRHASNGFWA